MTFYMEYPQQSNDNDFIDFFNQFKEVIILFGCRFINDKNIIYDIVMEVFVKMWLRRSQFNSMAAMKAYMYTSTKNACLNHIKQVLLRDRKKKHLLQLADEWEPYWLPIPVKEKLSWRLYAAIDELPEMYRRIIVLYYFAKWSYVKIAAVMNMPVSTLIYHKNKAEKLLKEKLLPGMDDEWLSLD